METITITIYEQPRLTPAEMIEIEPNLSSVENYVKVMNEEAKRKKIYWHKVWADCKRKHKNYVGWFADKPALQSSECWEDWHEHLKELAVHCI